MYTHAEISLTLLLTLMLALTFILRNSCKVKQNPPLPKDFSGKVGSDFLCVHAVVSSRKCFMQTVGLIQFAAVKG